MTGDRRAPTFPPVGPRYEAGAVLIKKGLEAGDPVDGGKLLGSGQPVTYGEDFAPIPLMNPWQQEGPAAGRQREIPCEQDW